MEVLRFTSDKTGLEAKAIAISVCFVLFETKSNILQITVYIDTIFSAQMIISKFCYITHLLL